MTSYARLQTEAQSDDLRALCWQLQYTEWLIGMAALAADPAGNGIGTMAVPQYGDPIDWDTRSRRLVWVTQACRDLVVHPMSGGRALAVCGPDVERWGTTGAEADVLPAAELAAVRSMGRDAAATRARTLLGVLGNEGHRVRRVRFADMPGFEARATVLARGDDFAARLLELEVDEATR